MRRTLGSLRFRMVCTGAALVIGAAMVHAGDGRKVTRSGEDVRQHSSEIALAKYLPYEGLGTVDLIDDGTLAIELGGLRWIDDEPVIVEPQQFFLLELGGTGISLVHHNGESFVDANGGELARRGLDVRNVVRTTLPERTSINSSSTRFSVLSVTGALSVTLDENAAVSISVDDVETGIQLFSFYGLLVTDTTGAAVASGDYPTAQPAGPRPGSDCHATCPGGASCDIYCGPQGCAAWCSGKKPKCMCLAQ